MVTKVYHHLCLRCSKPIETTDISEWVCPGSCRTKLRADEAVSDYPTVAEAKRAAQIFNKLKNSPPTAAKTDVYFDRDKDYT